VLEELWEGKTLVLSHVNADIDALGCSIALAAMFPNVTVGAVESVSRGAGNLRRHFGEKYPVVVDPPVAPNGAPYDRVVFVDTSAQMQVGHYAPLLPTSIVLDHHAPNSELRAGNPRYVCDPSSPSCAQLVHREAVAARARVGTDAAFALVAGIVADTERFRIAPNSAVRDALAILEEGKLELGQVISAMERPAYDRSQVVAVLKAAQRCEVLEVGQFLVARTRVGAFEASAARQLVSMGADVALVVSEDRGTTAMTGRAGRRALEAGFSLSAFMQELGARTGGDGGGHPGAGGYKSSKPPDEVEAQALSLAKDMLGRLNPHGEDG
jgi:nanoRNase/pAp phosphatase (c-di-AMP/oligoRNAs hydrolase)